MRSRSQILITNNALFSVTDERYSRWSNSNCYVSTNKCKSSDTINKINNHNSIKIKIENTKCLLQNHYATTFKK